MGSPSEERHALLSRLFEEVVELPATEREAWFAASDAPKELLDELRDLLSYHDGAVPFLDHVNEGSEPPRLEGFEFLEVLGRGGMGVVWAARQLQPERKVAIKLLASSLIDVSLARFRREINALGRLEHEAIARVYEAGVAEGRPYIVMEHVVGKPIDAQLGQDPDLEALLELFLRVCGGVAHAHARGIIHRDLKPANVLVTSEGQAKILDFGIARVLDDEESDLPTLHTQTGMILGTLPYMSPEQARGDMAAIGVPSDVYALGVMLYELVEGRRPLELEGLPLTAAVARISEEEPRPLTMRGRRFEKDLAIILQRALAKEPERRFPSVAAFAEDLERVLASEPILSRPPSTAYLLTRFAQRHRVLVAAAAFSVVVLLAATIISLSFAFQVQDKNVELEATQEKLERQREDALESATRADNEARTANTFVDFMIRTLLEGDPTNLEEPSLRGAIERVAEGVDRDLGTYPIVRARLHRFLGKMFEALGRPLVAEKHLTLGESLFAEFAPDHADRLPLMLERAHGLVRIERPQEALAQLQGYLGELERLGRLDTIDHLQGITLEAEILIQLGRLEEACSAAEKSLELGDALGAEDEIEASLQTYAGALLWLGRFDESREKLERVLALRRAKYAPNNPYIAETLHALGAVAIHSDRPAAALPLLDEALKIQEESLGATHSATLSSIETRAQAYAGLQRYEDALKDTERAAELSIASMGEGSPHHVWTLYIKGDFLRMLGRREDARDTFVEAVGHLRGAELPPDYIGTWFSIAELERDLENRAESLKWLREGIALVRELLPEGVARSHNLAAAGIVANANEEWQLACTLYDEILEAEKKGIQQENIIDRGANMLRHGRALLHLKGVEAGADMILEAKEILGGETISVRLKRELLHIELELRRLQNRAEDVKSLESQLEALLDEVRKKG